MPRGSQPRGQPTPNEFAEMAYGRLTHALEAYRALSDRWDTTSPVTLVQAADVALDAAIAVEASLKAIARDVGLDPASRRPEDLLAAILAHTAAPPDLVRDAAAIAKSLDIVRQARHRYVHAGLPQVSPQELLGAVRDAIRTVLLLGRAYDVLGRRWSDIAEVLWTFDGQPAHFARQVHEAFSGRRLDALPLRCQVERYTGGSSLLLSGALSAACEIEQSRWGGDGKVGSLLEFPGVKAEVSVIWPPEKGADRTEEGEAVHTGTMVLVARDMDAQVDGLPGGDCPLEAPIYLRPDDESAWMVGPGDLRITTLKLSIPYRARSQWFVTPDGRQEVVTRFLKHDEPGHATGIVRYHHLGHGGEPAYRGEAVLDGIIIPCHSALQIAEWHSVRVDPETHRLRSSWWGGVTRLHLRCDILASVSFGVVEVSER